MSHLNLLKDERISNFVKKSTYQFNDRAYLQRALQLADSIHKDGNKQLALVGDAVIDLDLKLQGLRRHATRGEISNVVSRIASNNYLANQGFSVGLAECVYKNPSQGSTISPGSMASTVEAVIGAVFLDSGEDLKAVEGVMQALGIFWPE